MTAAIRGGRPWPLGAHWDGQASTSPCSPRTPTHRAVPVRRRRRARAAARLALPGHSHDVWHGYLPGAAPGLVYGLRAHGPWRPERGHRFNAEQAAARPVCARDRRPLRLARRALRRRPAPPRPHGPARQRAARAEGARGRRSHDWRGDRPPAHAARRHRALRAARQGLHDAQPGVPEAPARHLRRPGAAMPRSRTCSARRHRGQPAAGAPAPRRATPRRAWACPTTGATTRSASSAPSRRSRAGQAGVSARDEFRAMVRAAARRRHRGDPRRGLQPHRRERRARPDASAGAAWTTRATTALPGHARGALREPHRLRQHARPAPAARAAAGAGQPALLGRRDARRRLPLRPGAGARPRRPRLRPPRARSSPRSRRTRCCRA